MTNILSNQNIEELRDYKVKKVNGEYIKIRKESPPRVDLRKLDDRKRAEDLADQFKKDFFD